MEIFLDDGCKLAGGGRTPLEKDLTEYMTLHEKYESKPTLQVTQQACVVFGGGVGGGGTPECF